MVPQVQTAVPHGTVPSQVQTAVPLDTVPPQKFSGATRYSTTTQVKTGTTRYSTTTKVQTVVPHRKKTLRTSPFTFTNSVPLYVTVTSQSSTLPFTNLSKRLIFSKPFSRLILRNIYIYIY